MKRLLHNQVVTLAVGDETIECRVSGFVGGEVALTPEPSEDASKLPAASSGASLVFEHRGGLVMLRGALYRGAREEGALQFAATRRASDGSEQRRRNARLELALPVTLVVIDDKGRLTQDERRLVTFDVSVGGLGLRISDRVYSLGTLLRFELVPPGAAPLVGIARVVHVTGEVCGLQFEEVGPTDRVRLAGYLVGAQRTRAKRLASVR